MMRQRVISGLAGWQRTGLAALLGASLCVCLGACNKAAPGPSVTVGAVVEASATSVPATVGTWRAASDQMVSELVDELVRRGADRGEVNAFVADVLASVTEAMASE